MESECHSNAILASNEYQPLHSRTGTIFGPPPLTLNHMHSATTPLHVVIGEKNDDSAQEYAIAALGEDFLMPQQDPRSSTAAPYHEMHYASGVLAAGTVSQASQRVPDAVLRRPQHLHLPFKRRSADVHTMITNTFGMSGSPSLTRSHEAIATSIPAVETATATAAPPANLGHRRSSSQGNPAQIWKALQPQQSMPCIANLPNDRPTTYNLPQAGTSLFFACLSFLVCRYLLQVESQP